MTINNEAILLSMIENAYLKRKNDRIYINSGEYWVLDDDVSTIGDAELFLVLQRALFDECEKQHFYLTVIRQELIIEEMFICEEIYRGDTSRESFALAYQKLVGIEL